MQGAYSVAVGLLDGEGESGGGRGGRGGHIVEGDMRDEKGHPILPKTCQR